MLLSVEHLSVGFPARYGAVSVIEDVSISIGPGEAVGLVGESGSGKSLLGHAIIGLLPAGAVVTGSVRVRGENMLALSPRSAHLIRGRLVSYIDQAALSALNPNRRIGAHFRDVWRSAGCEPSDGWKAAAIGALERVSLDAPGRVVAQYADELSGGMRQRVLIALAVFLKPRLLIADEPTTALDRVTATEVLDLLSELQVDLGMGMILISHDVTAVRRACDRLAVLYAGQLCELGETEDVIRTPIHRYTDALLRSVLSLRDATYPLSSIPGIVPYPSDFPSGCRFRNRCVAASSLCGDRRPLVRDENHSAWCTDPVRSASKEALS